MKKKCPFKNTKKIVFKKLFKFYAEMLKECASSTPMISLSTDASTAFSFVIENVSLPPSLPPSLSLILYSIT